MLYVIQSSQILEAKVLLFLLLLLISFYNEKREACLKSCDSEWHGYQLRSIPHQVLVSSHYINCLENVRVQHFVNFGLIGQ